MQNYKPINKFHQSNKEKLSIVKNNGKVSDKEIVIDASTIFSNKININKTFDYVNHQLIMLSGYDIFDLIDEPYNKLIHEDMPTLIYSVLNDRLKKGIPMTILEKLKSKEGSYFWLLSKYEPKLNKEGSIISYLVSSTKAPTKSIIEIEKTYKILKSIEIKSDNDTLSTRYFVGYLEDIGHTYNSFIKVLTKPKDSHKYQEELKKVIEQKIIESHKKSNKTQNYQSKPVFQNIIRQGA
jgi:PAS domain S-box-containing protein